MRKLLALGLLLLAGCGHIATNPDISGIWINQSLIDRAAQGTSLNTAGSNLEWDIDTRNGKAQASSGFEAGEGLLRQTAPDTWLVDYDGYGTDELRLEGEQLIQRAKAHAPQQTFQRSTDAPITGAPWSTTFRKALNAAYLGGQWRILDGPGTGKTLVFTADGGVSGLPGADSYELCLDGDCASQGAGHDTIYLGAKGQADSWIFVRKGEQLEIFQAINTAQADEVPQLTPGPRQWLLERQ